MPRSRPVYSRLRAAQLSLSDFASDPALDDVTIWDLNTTRDLLQIAEKVLGAAVAEANGNYESAQTLLQEAVKLEDALEYDEPPSWTVPPRQRLGALQLAAGKPETAEATYREELEIYPDNGWSLLGLSQALHAQGKHAEAERVHQRFEDAWQEADIRLKSSCKVARRD